MKENKVTVEFRVQPDYIDDEDHLLHKIVSKTKWKEEEISAWRITRRSIDARKAPVFFVLRVDVFRGPTAEQPDASPAYHTTSRNKTVAIVGAGPTGYFAALKCLQHGLKPIVLDRGKDVRTRRRDLRQIQQFGIVDPDSNYCFGEGGAGTYSDGKLYTRANKRGNVQGVLQALVAHGAKSDILVDAHPHIGSNKLPGIVANIRETIERHGGEVLFGHRVTDFIIDNGKIEGVSTNDKTVTADAVILATGHSARDVFDLCARKKVAMEFKPFAVGVRIEHPQALIDSIQYHQRQKHPKLPPASYRLACRIKDRGVFSFCMCPGGLIVPTATAPGELVVNGMSLSKRDSPYANSGLVVSIDQNPNQGNVFGGLDYQKELEQRFFQYGDGGQSAPAQRITDFVNGQKSQDLPGTSYIPGIYPGSLHTLLPNDIYTALRLALRRFDKNVKGYFTREGQLIGLESRTSSPVRICRHQDSLMAPGVKGLFPGGEGAGFAGGILSAALDGERLGDAVMSYLK